MKLLLSAAMVIVLSSQLYGQSSSQSDNRPVVTDHEKNQLGEGGSPIEEILEVS